MLDAITTDLTGDRGALLRSFLFRFTHAATQFVPARSFLRPPVGEMTPEARAFLDQLVRLPDFPLWRPIIEWMNRRAEQLMSLAQDELIEAAEFWLTSMNFFLSDDMFEERHTHLLSRVILSLAERVALAGGRYSRHSSVGKMHVRLYQLMLLCAPQAPSAVRKLVSLLSGLEGAAAPAERGIVHWPIRPPLRFPPINKPVAWPQGPKVEPSEQFRRAALTSPGAERLIALDPGFARDVFLALLIEVPDPDEDIRPDFRYGFDYHASSQYANPPFWEFPPAHGLLAKDPAVGIDFIITVTDFSTDRWAEAWPHVPHGGTMFEEPQTEAPSLTLTVEGADRGYIGDSRAMEWYRGGHQGSDVSAAVLMSLEHWLYEQMTGQQLSSALLRDILLKTHSVAVLGVLLSLALMNPALLLGPLEPLVQSAEILRWSRQRAGRGISNARTSMIAWMGKEPARIQGAHAWHTLEHRERDLLQVATHLFVQLGFDWPAIFEARDRWAKIADQTSDDSLRAWIRDILLPYFDKTNWHSTLESDGRQMWEYVHPPAIEQRQSAVRAAIEANLLLRGLPLRCRGIIDGERSIDEKDLLDLLDMADGSPSRISKDDAWLMGGEWSPRCGAAAVAFLKFETWLSQNPAWQTKCRNWLIDACLSYAANLRPHPGLGGFSWDSFCAETIPLLWSRDQQNKDLRRCIAHLISAPHEDARQRLFMTLARRRAEYPEDFGRLLHLAVWMARLVALDTGPPPEPNSGGSEADKAFRRLVGEFVRGRLVPLPKNWLEISKRRPAGLAINPYGERDGLGDNLLVGVLDWLAAEAPGCHQAHDREILRTLVEGLANVVPQRLNDSYDEETEQRNRWSAQDLLSAPATVSLSQPLPTRAPERPKDTPSRLARTVSRIRGTVLGGLAAIREKVGQGGEHPPPRPSVAERRRRPIGTPYESDYRIASMIATFLVHDPDVMSRRKLWEPWLRLGDACRSWVEILLDEIFTAAAHAGNQDAIFGKLIGDIFDHALANGGWLDGKAHQAYRMSEIGKAFLGAGRLSSGEFWSVNRAPVAIALQTYWPRWADVAIAWHGCAASFIRLLRTPAMESLRPGCLQWLVRSDTNRWMSEDDARRALVRLLELVWSERLQDGKELRAEIRIVFERLLRELVTHQNADAVLLSTLVAREV